MAAARSGPRGAGSKKPPAPVSFVGEVCSGDQRRALEAMRAKLADAMDIAPPMVIAQVAARLQAVVESLAELPEAEAVSRSDDLAARRRERRAAAGMDSHPSGQGVKRGSRGGRARS